MEVDGAVIELAEMRFCEADVVVTAVVVGRETGDRAEIGEAGLGITFEKKSCAWCLF